MPNLLDIATFLVLERALSVFPLDHPDNPATDRPDQVGKTPLTRWKRFQSLRATVDDLRVWFGGGVSRNLAIVTGQLSGVVGIDCDSREAEAWAEAHLPATSMQTQTHRGRHRYYRHPGSAVPNRVCLKTGDRRVKLDVRGDGGYLVGPGSRHRRGTVYEPLGTWSAISELPPFDPAWIAPTPQPSALPRPTWSGVGEPDQLLRRARAYLTKVPGAVEGQGGDAATFWVACVLVRDFGLSPGDARALLGEWNATCVPPWDERDLDAKIANALRYGHGPVGEKALGATAETRPRSRWGRLRR